MPLSDGVATSRCSRVLRDFFDVHIFVRGICLPSTVTDNMLRRQLSKNALTRDWIAPLLVLQPRRRYLAGPGEGTNNQEKALFRSRGHVQHYTRVRAPFTVVRVRLPGVAAALILALKVFHEQRPEKRFEDPR
jgi:hypothetical protein